MAKYLKCCLMAGQMPSCVIRHKLAICTCERIEYNFAIAAYRAELLHKNKN